MSLQKTIVNAFDERLVRTYSRIRFAILRKSILKDIFDALPDEGMVLDVGCGFGLFTLYFATIKPKVQFIGFDLDSRRIACASQAAANLGLGNVQFDVRDASSFVWDRPLAGAYLIDLVHHIPPFSVEPLLRQVVNQLAPASRVIVKDIAPRPICKMWFTWLLDKAMDSKAPVHYWAEAELKQLLGSTGCDVSSRRIRDVLPFPHVLYVGVRR